MGKEPLTPLLEGLVQPIRATLVPGDDLTKAIQGNARNSAAQLTARSAVLKDAVAAGKLSIRSAYFDIGSGKVSLLGGGRYLMRPLDIDDLSAAILSACATHPTGVHVHELAGLEPIAYRALIERVAGMMGRTVTYGNVPIWVARLGAAINSRLKGGGGFNPTVIDVITTSEEVPHNADADLGITLTPLATTLEKIVTSWRRTQ